MAKIFKISGYLVDAEDEHTAEDIEVGLDEGFSGVFGQHIHVQESDVGEWSDDIPLNLENCDLAECEKYFHAEPTRSSDRRVAPGEVYKHFKGKTVKVIAVSQDTESPGAYSVVYECMDGENKGKIWHRPYDMFVSEVDHVKYPDVKQKYRFEKIWSTFDGWKSCSKDGNPGIDGEYLVTAETTRGYRYRRIAKYSVKSGRWDCLNVVMAWRELPDGYEEDE